MEKKHEGVQGIGNEIEPDAPRLRVTIPDVRALIKSKPVIAGAAVKIWAKKKTGLKAGPEADSGLTPHMWSKHSADVLRVVKALDGIGGAK